MRFVIAGVLLLGMGAMHSLMAQQRYVAPFTNRPPVIDGIIADGEWGNMELVGDWQLLQTPNNAEPDDNNNRFGVLWNDSGIFLQQQVDNGSWDQRGIESLDLAYENVHFYFDPNTDGETNDQSAEHDTGIDGYLIAFNQPAGESSISPEGVSAGVAVEAHVNGLFGDQGAPWSGFANAVIHSVVGEQDGPGVAEVFIPWSDFDATNPDEGFDPSTGDDIGLFHPHGPSPGDEWFFNVARIATNGDLPVWESGFFNRTVLCRATSRNSSVRWRWRSS